MPDFGIFRGFNEKLFGDKLVAGQLPTQLGLIGSETFGYVYLLDIYPNAAAAYSLRSLRSAYSGSAIRVRRASDNTEQDIGFVNNELDTSTLTSFCSGTDGFVKTWYDQSGNANDAEQTTLANQPQIVSSGSVILENGKPAAQYDGVNDSLASTLSNFSGTISLVGVCRINNVTQAPIVANLGDASFGSVIGNINSTFRIQNVNSSYVIYTGISMIINNQSLQIVTRDSSNVWNWYENNISKGSQTLSGDMNLKVIGARLGGAGQVYATGNFQEVILYASDQSTNRTGIQTNINDFYSIY